jgi:LPS-assembly lipoprotein
LQLTRAVTYDDAIILAKEAEEQQLYRDMQFDMVQLVMRRLAAAQKPKPRPN